MEETNKVHRVVSLFAGIGGIDLGFINAGAKVIWSNDFDSNAGKTFQLNFPETIFDGRSIQSIPSKEIPEHDILAAGFPCQAFSIAGNRQGFNDHRGNLFFEIERLLVESEHKPEVIFLENVKNLQNHDNKNTFRVISSRLADAGYHIKAKVLNTAEYGNIPQNRERIYIVGFRHKELLDQFEFPQKIDLTNKVNNFFDRTLQQDKKYYYSARSQYYPLLSSAMANSQEDSVYQIRRIYVRENKSGLCPTLTANMGMGGHNVPIIKDKYGIRKITPREAFNLQGFPSDFKIPSTLADSHLYKQAGNSVSVPVIYRIAKNIIDVLDGHCGY